MNKKKTDTHNFLCGFKRMFITAFEDLDAGGNKIFIFFFLFEEPEIRPWIEKEKKISTIIAIWINYMFI
jgi:glutaredoxin-related protein